MRAWIWFFAASCAHVAASSAPVVARMHRGECLGPCPTYTVTIYRDGTVEYDGHTHVAVTGYRVAKVGPDVIARLEAELTQLDFLRLPDYVHPSCTDRPLVTLTYHGKTLRHDHGDLAAPDDLFALENLTFDQRLGTVRWVGKSPYVAVPWCKIWGAGKHRAAK